VADPRDHFVLERLPAQRRNPALAAELHGDVLSDDHVADNASVWTANLIRGKLDPDSCGAEDSLKGGAAVLGLLAGLSNSACDDARVGGHFPLHEQASDWGSNARPEIHFVGDDSAFFVLDSVIAILPVVLLRQKTAAAKQFRVGVSDMVSSPSLPCRAKCGESACPFRRIMRRRSARQRHQRCQQNPARHPAQRSDREHARGRPLLPWILMALQRLEPHREIAPPAGQASWSSHRLDRLVGTF
jgi:hypothetical protein